MEHYAELFGTNKLDDVISQPLEFVFKGDSQFKHWLIEDPSQSARSTAQKSNSKEQGNDGGPATIQRILASKGTAALFPQFVPTAECLSLGFPRWKLDGSYNRLTRSSSFRTPSVSGAATSHRVVKHRSVIAAARNIDILQRTDGTRMPVLHGVSTHVVSKPPTGLIKHRVLVYEAFW